MKTALLCLTLCGLVWTQSEVQPQPKCEGEHQITVKGRHSNHGFYIFNYIYSSLMPNNQSQIQKEDNNKTISTAIDVLDKKHKPRKSSENLTPAPQERSGEQTHLTGRDDIQPEDRTIPGRKQKVEKHHGSINNWDLQQHHLEFIAGKGEGESARGDNTIEIDGSGDIDFPGQVSIDHGIIVGKEDGDHRKGHKISSSTESGKFEGKGKSGKSVTAKPPKNGIIKIWVKENDANLIQETNSYNDISRKIKDPPSKDYPEVSLKGKTNSTSKESSRKAGKNLGFSEKQVNVTARLYSNFNIQSNVSRDVLEKDDHTTTKTNFTSSSGTIGIKVGSEEGNHNATMHKKSEYEPTVIVIKLDGQKDQSGVAKPHQKSEARGDSDIHVEVFDAIKPHKKDNEKKDAISGISRNKTEAISISKTHKKDKGDTGITGESISQVEDPIFTKPGRRKHTEATGISKMLKKEKGEADITQKVVSHMEDPFFGKLNKTNQIGIILSVKVKDHVNGVTKSYPKGEIMSNEIISDSQVSTSKIIEQGRKDVTHKKSNIGQEEVELTKVHQKEVASNEKIKTNLPESSMGDPATDEKEKNGLGVTFQDISKDTVKESINSYKDTGSITDLTRVDNRESSDRKAEQQSHKPVPLDGALSLSRGSHNSVQLFSLPKNGGVQNQEHSSPSVKVVEKVIKPSREIANVHTGTHRDQVAIRYQKYSGVLRRKSSRHDKKHPSLKKAHRSDSSQSSESEEKRWKGSRQSYEDYQNDQADSYQSAESAEALSQESNQSDNHSRVKDRKTSSQHDSREMKALLKLAFKV